MARQHEIKFKVTIDEKQLGKLSQNYSTHIKKMEKESKGFIYSFKEALRAVQGGFFSSIGGDLKRLAGKPFQFIMNSAHEAFQSVKDLDKGIREISTLLNDEQIARAGGLEGLSKQAKDLSLTFNKDIPDATKSMYQAISSGVSDTGLKNFMEVAGKLSVGGVTSMTTAVDGMTNLVNAFGESYDDVERLNQISDTLFTGMKYGKTTVDELSRSLGKAAPFAKMMGLSIEELVASSAAITTGGKSTTNSVNELKSLLMAVMKPVKYARENMNALGIEFGETALKNKTLNEWLIDTKSKLDASGKGWKDIFANVRAFSGALTLTGSAGEKYTQIMNELADASNKAGSITDKAFKKVEEGLEERIGRMKKEFTQSFMTIIEKMLPAFEALLPIFSKLAPIIETIGVALASIFESELFKGAIDLIGQIVDGLGWIIAPSKMAQKEFDVLYESIKKNKEAIEGIKKLDIKMDLGNPEKSLEDLKNKMVEITAISPELANEIDAIAMSSLNASDKVDLVTKALQDFENQTNHLTSEDKKKLVLDFFTTQKNAIDNFAITLNKMNNLYAKGFKDSGLSIEQGMNFTKLLQKSAVSPLKGKELEEFNFISAKLRENLTTEQLKDLDNLKLQLEDIKILFQESGDKLKELIPKEEYIKIMEEINTELAFAMTGPSFENAERGLKFAKEGILDLTTIAASQAALAASLYNNTDALAKKEAEKEAIYAKQAQVLVSINQLQGLGKVISEEDLKVQQDINNASDEEKKKIIEKIEFEKGLLQVKMNSLQFAKDLAGKIKPDADTTEIDTEIEATKSKIENINNLISGIKPIEVPVTLATEEGGVSGLDLGSLQNKITKSFSNIPVKFDFLVEDQKAYLEYVEAEYQLHLNRIKEMEVANNEETDELIKEETIQRLEDMKAELETERIDAIKEYLFGTDAYEMEAEKIKASVEGIFATGVGEEQQAQIQSLIDKEQERVEILKAQIGLLQQQYGADLQARMQEVIALEEERKERIADANSEAEKATINQEYDAKKATIEKEIEVIRERQAYAENQITIEEDLINYLNSSIGKMKDQRDEQEKLAKEIEEQRKEDEKRQEEYRKQEEEDRKKEREQKEKDAEEEQKRLDELAKEREKRNKEALDYLKKQNTSEIEVIQKIEQAHDDWRSVWGETLDEAMMLDEEVRAALESAHDKFNRDIVTGYIKEVEDAFKEIDVNSTEAIDNAFKMLEEANKAAEEIKAKIGDEIPQSLINQLDNMSNKIWANLYTQLRKSLDKLTKELFSKYGGERYREITRELKITEATTQIGEDFATALKTANDLVETALGDTYKKAFISDYVTKANELLQNSINAVTSDIEKEEDAIASANGVFENYIALEKEYTKAIEERSDATESLTEDEAMLKKQKENLIQLDKDLLALEQKKKSYEAVEQTLLDKKLTYKITDTRQRITTSQLKDILKTITDEDLKKLVQANYDAGEDTWEKLFAFIKTSEEELKKKIEWTTKDLEEWTPDFIKELEVRIAEAKKTLEKVLPTKPGEKPAGLETYLEDKKGGKLDSETLLANREKLKNLLEEQKNLITTLTPEAKKQLEIEKNKLKDERDALLVLKEQAIEIARINILYEDSLSSAQKLFDLELARMKLHGATELELLDKQILQQKALVGSAMQRVLAEERIVGKGNASVETYQALADAELSLQDLIKQRTQLLQQQFLDVISQVQTFADMLKQAFDDGVISAGELLDILTETIVQLGSKIADVFAPGSGQIIQAVVGLVGTMQSIFGSIFQEIIGGNEVFKNLNEQKMLNEQINALLESRNKLMEAMIKMGNKELDTLAEQVDYLKESLNLLIKKLGLEGQSAEQVLANYQDLLEKYDEINQAIIALQGDIADDNLFEQIGYWFAGWAGMSKEDQLARLQAELEALGLQIDNYEQLLELQQMIIDKEKERVKEMWDIARLQAELSGDITGSYDAQINYIKEMIARAEDFHLTQLEILELEQQLNQLYEDRYDAVTDAYNKEMELAIKKARLQGASEEQIQQMQLQMIENLIEAKKLEIEQLGTSTERETELVDLELERLDIQKQINGELGQQGVLMNENVRALIRQVIEARKLGDVMAEQQNLEMAAQGLLAQGLSLPQINSLLGTNFENLGQITSGNVGANGIGEFDSSRFDVLAKQVENQPLLSSMVALNQTSANQLQVMQSVNSNLVMLVSLIKGGNKQSTFNRHETASSISRFLREVDRINLN